MGYLRWALLALVSYTFVAPLMKYATDEIPVAVAVTVSNSVLVLAALAVALSSEATLGDYLSHPRMLHVVLAGVCLAVGILAYYKALSLGPVSVVTPIYGMFMVTSSAVGILVLGEALTLRRLVGIGCAVLAVYLTAGPQT